MEVYVNSTYAYVYQLSFNPSDRHVHGFVSRGKSLKAIHLILYAISKIILHESEIINAK